MLSHAALDQTIQDMYVAYQAGSPNSVISILKSFPPLYLILYWTDRLGAIVIFADPNHTISYNIAIRAKAGEQWAIDCCSMLNLLSPDHCTWALQNESLLRLN